MTEDQVGWLGQVDQAASRGAEGPAPPGQMAVVSVALAIGILLMAVQLWLLTTALDSYLSGQIGQVWVHTLISGLIFLGGLGMLWLLRRRPRILRKTTGLPPPIER